MISSFSRVTTTPSTAYRHSRLSLNSKALMSLGHPGESEETIRATRDWLLEVRPSDFDASVITPYPGSPYYDHALPTGALHNGKPSWVYTCKKGDRLYQEEVHHELEADYSTRAIQTTGILPMSGPTS